MKNIIRIEILIIVVLTLVLYLPSLQFDFVNYDDQVYVTQNEFVLSPSINSLLDGSGTGNFHPLTMLSLRMDYFLGSGKPFTFHLTSLLLHLLNSVLVLFVTKKLFPSVKGIGIFVAVLFAIHPMHIESVAWISSRKDLMYTLFYLISILSYIHFIDHKNVKYFYFALLAGTLSLLSKPAAITLPVVLLMIHFFRTGKVTWKDSLKLAPLFAGSIAIGLTTLVLQNKDAINDLVTYSVLDRIQFAFYGIFYYFTKAVVPSHFTAMHPYPSVSEMVSIAFLVPVFFGGILLSLGGYLSFKKRSLGFGLIFFLLHLVLMLQLVSIGRAIVAERYTYMAYVGLFIFIGLGIHLLTPGIRKNVILYIIAGAISLPLFLLSNSQISVWSNSETLWSKAILEYPDDWYGRIGRGNYYRDSGQYSKALTDYSKAIEIEPSKFENYFNLGDLQNELGQTPQAILTYSKAIEIAPNYEQAYLNRGQFYLYLQDVNNALIDFNKAIEINANSYHAYNNRGNLFLQLGQLESALNDFNNSIELNPAYANSWYNRGTAQITSNQNKAISDLNQAIQLDPMYFDAYNNIGSVYYQIQDYQNASWAFTKAIEVNPSVASTWLNLAIVQNIQGNYSAALANAKQCQVLGGNVSSSFLNELQAKSQ